MAAFNFFNIFTEDLLRNSHDFDVHTFKWMLTNTAPVATNTIKANITEIAAGNGYVAGGPVTAITIARTGLTTKISASDATITASGGQIPSLRYAVLYNDTLTNKNLIGWSDYGSSFPIEVTETFTINPDDTNGLFTLGP